MGTAVHSARHGRGGEGGYITFVGLDINTNTILYCDWINTIGKLPVSGFAEMRKVEHCNIEKPNVNNERSIQRMWQKDTEEIIILNIGPLYNYS